MKKLVESLVESLIDLDEFGDIPRIRMDQEKYNSKYCYDSEIDQPFWEFVIDKKSGAPCSLKSGSVKYIDLNTTTFTAPPRSFYNFAGKCYELKTFILGSDWDLSRLRNTMYMFDNCKKLENIEFPINWKETKLKNVEWMFNGCNSLEKIDLSNVDFSNVETAAGMFSDCYKLEDINFGNSKWNHLTNISCMFFGCDKLKKIDLTNVSNGNPSVFHDTIRDPFWLCHNLETIDGELDFSYLSFYEMDNMFCECSKLRNVNIKNIKYNPDISKSDSNDGKITLKNIQNLSKSSIDYLFKNMGNGKDHRGDQLTIIVSKKWVKTVGEKKIKDYKDLLAQKNWILEISDWF